ncbi:MAG TPA: hypothetical protein VNO50_08030 [Pyrinomonadaceae bacterium]|nr:hypothetical protein [Pyrinomonadaceae bacterium]
MLRKVILLSLVAFICSSCSKNSGAIGPTSPATQTPASPSRPVQSAAGELRYKVPDGWKVETPTSDMRAAQYKLPKAEGDTEDALLILYYFGQGQGGSAQANIDRWISQIVQPDGQPSKERAKIGTAIINGLAVDTVDLTGNYSGGMSPDSAPANKQAVYRLRGAVIATPKGSYFVKLTGPEKTVGYWDRGYTEYLQSFEFR